MLNMEDAQKLIGEIVVGNLRVVFNNDVVGTKIFTEAGEDISKHVRHVSIGHKAGELPTVWIELIGPLRGEVVGQTDGNSKLVEIDITGHGQTHRSFAATKFPVKAEVMP